MKKLLDLNDENAYLKRVCESSYKFVFLSCGFGQPWKGTE